MKIIIDSEGNKLLWKKGDLHTSFGVVKEDKIKNGIVETHLGKNLVIFDAHFVDLLERIERGPAIMNKKDIGTILSYTGINSKSEIVDAGTGCGILAACLGNISKNVVSYERRKDFYELAQRNLKFLGVKIKLKQKDIFDGIDEKNLDLITLDLLEPWKVVKHAQRNLKSGGFLVSYLTNINQVSQLVDNLDGFYFEKVLETIERGWVVDGVKVRPEHQGLLHTGFLVFARRI